MLVSKIFHSVLHHRCSTIISKTTNLLSAHSGCDITQRRWLFMEPYRKGGYDTKIKVPRTTQIKEGFKELKTEIKLFYEEILEFAKFDPTFFTRPGEIDLIWCFNEPKVLDNFVATSDSDNKEGYSKCVFEMSPAGRAVFRGTLNSRVPKDGRATKAGYCSIRSKRVRKSFKRESCYNWTHYNTLVLKIRGDGRSYMLNLSCEGYHDITWNDIYHFVLFTRGGPYWQVAKIPFSKFIFGSKGRVQDKQMRIRLDRVTHFGIAAGDKIDGKFNLEIEYVGLEFDPKHEEEFAYEMYMTEKYIVGV